MRSSGPRNAVPLGALLAAVALAACSTPATTSAPTAANPPATQAGPTSAPVAGEPCSFLTAEQVRDVVGTTPVEIAERVGRGDCDYWLDASKSAKVNINVATGPDAASLFDLTKGLGDPQLVDLGDEAYSIFNQSIGTLVVVRTGESVAVVQLLTAADATNQRAQAIRLAEAVLAGL